MVFFACFWIFNFPLGIEAGDLRRLNGGLTLGIVEISRHGDHGLAHGVTEVSLSRLLELAQDHGGNFGRRVVLAVDVNLGQFVASAHNLVRNQLLFTFHFLAAATHKALDAIHRAARIGHCLALGRITHQPVALVCKCHHAGCDAVALGVGNDFYFATFHHGDHAVGGTQVDADDFLFCHDR